MATNYAQQFIALSEGFNRRWDQFTDPATNQKNFAQNQLPVITSFAGIAQRNRQLGLDEQAMSLREQAMNFNMDQDRQKMDMESQLFPAKYAQQNALAKAAEYDLSNLEKAYGESDAFVAGIKGIDFSDPDKAQVDLLRNNADHPYASVLPQNRKMAEDASKFAAFQGLQRKTAESAEKTLTQKQLDEQVNTIWPQEGQDLFMQAETLGVFDTPEGNLTGDQIRVKEKIDTMQKENPVAYRALEHARTVQGYKDSRGGDTKSADNSFKDFIQGMDKKLEAIAKAPAEANYGGAPTPDQIARLAERENEAAKIFSARQNLLFLSRKGLNDPAFLNAWGEALELYGTPELQAPSPTGSYQSAQPWLDDVLPVK